MSRAFWITDSLDIADGQALIIGPQWDCSSDLWASDLDSSKTNESQVWDLDINSSSLGKPRKRITAESGRGSSVILASTRRKSQSYQFPKGPAFTVTWMDLEQGLTFCWTEPFVLHPTWWHRLIKWTTWLSRQAEDLVMIPWGGSRGLCNYARSLKLQDSYLDILCCEQQFGGAVIFLLWVTSYLASPCVWLGHYARSLPASYPRGRPEL